MLLALAEIQALERDDRPLSMALETLGFIEAAMADARHGGWREAVPARLPRRQNPHMHLLEAMLAWLRVRDRPAFRSVAERVLALFDARFARSDGALIERFTRAWTPHSVHGTVVEPGHHAEWIWLLEEARALGLGDRTAARDALYDRLRVQLGMDGWAVNAVLTDGTPINAGRRLWPQCEVLRAHLVMGERAAAERLARAILDTHLNAPTSGLWIDAFDDRGEPKHGLTPASSFYHLTGAVLALSRYGV